MNQLGIRLRSRARLFPHSTTHMADPGEQATDRRRAQVAPQRTKWAGALDYKGLSIKE